MTLRALDHFLITVENLELAAQRYTALGFHVRPLAEHVHIGSANHIIQLQSTYIELFGDIEKIRADFKPFYVELLAKGEGHGNFSLTSSDLEADRARLAALGVATQPAVSAARPVTMPDGSRQFTDSSSFYSERPTRPYMTPFFSVHRRPETIFTPEYQQHPNGARDVIGIICGSVDPAEDAEHIARLAEGAEISRNGDDRIISLARGGRVEILTQETLTAQYGVACAFDPTTGGRAVGLIVKTESLDICRNALKAGDAPFYTREDGLLVPCSAGCGSFILFTE